MTEQYDVVVVGAGQAGGPLATAFARAGRRAALVERAHVGGSCVNVGCTPTKTLIASGRVAHVARVAAEYGVHAGPVRVDMARARERKDAMVASWRAGAEESTRQAGVELVRGEARFTAPRTLAVALHGGAERLLTAPTIVLDTGARPAPPDLPGLDRVPFLDSTSVMELGAVPGHLLILGGGYVALEFGQLFRRLGAAVTIVEQAPQLLGREDADIAAAMAEILREDGITVQLRGEARRVAGREGAVELVVATPDGERAFHGSHLLVAAGRRPNSEALNLAAAGVEADERGHIRVNERLETSAPGVYAAGDVTGGPAFTHIAYDDFRVLRANLLEGGDASTAGRMVPYTVFTDPQLGRVGLGEDEARRQGRPIKVARLEMGAVARAREVGETRGLMKAVVDGETGQILGAAVLGMEGGEIMSMLQIAMLGGLHYSALRDAVFAHPTLAEALNNLFAEL